MWSVLGTEARFVLGRLSCTWYGVTEGRMPSVLFSAKIIRTETENLWFGGLSCTVTEERMPSFFIFGEDYS